MVNFTLRWLKVFQIPRQICLTKALPWVWAQQAWAAFLLPEGSSWSNPVLSSSSCLVETAHREEQPNVQELIEVSKRPSQITSSCPVDKQVIRAATELYYEENNVFQGKCQAKTLQNTEVINLTS